ncbi:methyltransferase domain-containing protein [Zymoseptoria brevis]|uniref:Methyltransferase domain-containing protein n=1 Tax=Zymoseptoria brevis TaxID=1047168 RepID=A0A0F4GEG9_9PEZI|nr:methyltransferase domain-containing protein [Zymoseptoria brevis]
MNDFWDSQDPDLSPDFRELLAGHSRIPPESFCEHIKEVRAKAWEVQKYPCIGSYMFLHLSMKQHPAYPATLDSLRSSNDAMLLDLGCCLGQDLRKLAHDGVPSEQLVGYDIEPGFFSVGYEAFRDKSHFQARFIAGNFLAAGVPGSAEKEQYQFIHAAYFFHLWSWRKQVEAYTKAILMLKDEPGCVLFGVNTGVENARLIDDGGPFSRLDENQEYTWLHDTKSMTRMLDEVAVKTGRQLQVTVEERAIIDPRTLSVQAVADLGWTRALTFTVRTT